MPEGSGASISTRPTDDIIADIDKAYTDPGPKGVDFNKIKALGEELNKAKAQQ
jgi:hypothetical protein